MFPLGMVKSTLFTADTAAYRFDTPLSTIMDRSSTFVSTLQNPTENSVKHQSP
jgi:hypothetical protein